MKPIPTLAMAAWTLASLPLLAQTATPEFDPLDQINDLPKMIRVQVEFIEVEHAELTELMDSEVAKSDTKLRAEVGKMVAAKKATIYETLMVTARPGQKATSESIEEFIYPTEYEPPELPAEIHTTEDGEKVKSDGKDYATGPTPTAFETRNLGSTLEIEPNLGANNKIIDLRFSPEMVFHVRNETWAEWKGQHGDAPIQMPVMYSMRTSTSITLLDGTYCFVAALSPKNAEGFPNFDKKLMVFVRADVVTVGR